LDMTGIALRTLAFAGLLLLILAPGCTPDVAIRQPTTLNLMEVAKAAITYAAHHDNRLPPAFSWPQALATEEDLPETALADPANPAAGRMFAMNAKLSNVSRGAVARPGETVLFFECAPGSPPSGGAGLLPAQPRSPQGYAIAFADGHVELVPPGAVKNLRWEP
jgi:prepilin-type processing-associated H-X9-DG protein